MAVTRLTYKLDAGVNIIDLAHGMSITERRHIHQKAVFTIMGGMVVDDATNTKLKISTAPNNFYTRNAVTRGFRAWKAQRAKALGSETGVKSAKYASYRVKLDGSADSTYLRPFSAGSVELSAGEWDYSDLTADAGGVTKQMKIVGGPSDPDSLYNLSLGWLSTRAANQVSEPNMPDLNGDGNEDINTDFISTLFQDTNESSLRIDDVIEEGDHPPFPRLELMTTQSTYSSSEPKNLQLQFIHHSSANELAHSVPGFQALCGLLRVDVSGGSNPVLIIDVDTKGWNF
jgi:hypothetical protein